jgi:hypothetical protein
MISANAFAVRPRLGLVHPISARVIAESNQEQNTQPHQSGDAEESGQIGGMAHAHEDPSDHRSFGDGDQKRDDDIPFAKLEV